MKMLLRPLYEKIVVKLDDKQEIKTQSGLVYTKNMSLSNNTTIRATVVAVGDGRLMADGTLVPLKVQVGDTVIYSKMQGESYSDGENEYTILSESCILAIVNNEEEK